MSKSVSKEAVEIATKLRESQQRGSPTLRAAGAKPRTDEELINCFSEDCIDAREKAIRAVARDYDIPLDVAGKIQQHFYKYDTDHSGMIDKDEFRAIVRDMSCVGKTKKVEVPESLVDQYFVQADRRRIGGCTIEDFLIWSWSSGKY
jgi:hypothetical protein